LTTSGAGGAEETSDDDDADADTSDVVNARVDAAARRRHADVIARVARGRSADVIAVLSVAIIHAEVSRGVRARVVGVGASASVVNAERESRASSGGATSRKRNLKTNVVAHFFDAASEERPFGGGERGRTRVFLRFTTTLQTLQHATRLR
jgi:hypothetical protein